MGKPCIKCGSTERYKSGACGACARAYYAANRNKMIAQAQAWRASNQAKDAANYKAWYTANRTKIIAQVRVYQAARPDVVAACRKAYLSSPAKTAKRHRRRAAKKGNGGSHTSLEWRLLVAHYGGKCLKCGRGDILITVDHIRPISMGGANSIENIQPLCLSCNSGKGATHIDYRPDAGPERWVQKPLLESP